MLLPGATYVVIVLAGLVDITLCAVLAFLVGSLAFKVAEFLIHRTKAWEIHCRGTKDSARWWFDLRAWTGVFTLGFFIIFIYTFAGPYFTFIEYIGGL